MNLLNAKVKHKIFGIGEIIEVKDEFVTVAFSSKTTKIAYPSAFASFIRAIDDNVQEYIIGEIEKAKKAEEEKKRLEAEYHRALEEKLAAEKQAAVSLKTNNMSKSAPASKRIEGQIRVFWVFQNQTYLEESSEEYIFAAFHGPHHWERLADVRQDDIIIHCYHAEVVAISRALDSAYSWKRYDGLVGRRIDCEYHELVNGIRTAERKAQNIELCSGVLYQPFNKLGTGNEGYLYEMTSELRDYYLSEIVKYNSYILREFPELESYMS